MEHDVSRVLDIQLELTDFCNFHCPFCNADSDPRPHRHPMGFIDPGLVERLLSDLSASTRHFSRITFQLNWCGEPSLHPEFTEIIRLFSRFSARLSLDKLELHTNCSNWNADTVSQFIEIVNTFESKTFFQVTFSVDSLDNCSYRSIRSGGTLQHTLKTLVAFHQIRNSKSYVFPRYVYQFIPVNQNCSHICDDINRIFSELDCSKVIFKPYDRPLDTGELIDVVYICPCLPLNDERIGFWKSVSERFGFPSNQISQVLCQFRNPADCCRHFFETPTISWKGEVTVCPADEKFSLCLGSLSENSLTEIWFGKPAVDYRKEVTRGNYPEFCKRSCFYTTS